ncbi:unnamed protein product [Cuscuta epithymum]|uniref:Fungal lipase-type domain-containing protein n=2 Tax=Cuscuta epithymum TaxID=186058 RepID=A0AAV0CIB8_9ASTE|nr:unnamed protein product [Cuscuta epithymum]
MAPGGKEELCSDYVMLKPGAAASFSGFLKFLFSSGGLKTGDFFDSPAETDTGRLRFRTRFLVLVSVIVKNVLIYLKAPLAWLGSSLEIFLNYPSFNGGYVRLILNFLTGSMVRPETTSENFRSFLAILDNRVDFDPDIKNGDSRYTPLLSIMAAKLSYENKDFVQKVITNNWKMEFLEFKNFQSDNAEDKSTQAIMLQDKSDDPNLVVVAFRGTEPFSADDLRTDADLSWYKIEGVGRIHAGFMRALGLRKNNVRPNGIERGPDMSELAYYEIQEKLREIISVNKNAKFILTGHSLGGALSILFAAVLAMEEEDGLLGRLEGIYTFGQPRVGDVEFGMFVGENLLRKYGVRYFRYVYANDIVPRVPYDDEANFFRHFGPCLYYNSFYHGKVLEEEPNMNYFSLLWMIPKKFNALFEVMRGFMLPWILGEDYREGWVLIICRIIGIMFTGLIDHGFQDYVNLIRLGTPPASLHFPEPAQQQCLKCD